MDTLQKDIQLAFTDAVDHGNFNTLWDLAKNRKGACFFLLYLGVNDKCKIRLWSSVYVAHT